MIRTTTLSVFLFIGLVIFIPTDSISQNSQNAIQSIIEAQNLKSISSASQQTKKIYEWITQNIQYDTQKEYTISSSRDEYIELADRVAIERKAVCLGYAALFKKLCDELDIPAFVAKGKVYIPGESELENHAWVVFKTENAWRLADPTWGSGHVSGHYFTFRQNWKFYKMEAEEFVKTHYPFEPAFQLLNQPVTFNMFQNRNFKSQSAALDYKEILEHRLENDDPVENLRRALEYKPGDSYLMHDLATYLQERAAKLAGDCIRVFNRNGRIPKDSECNEDILKAEEYLENAVYLFQKIIEQKSPQIQMAWMNMASAKNNLKTIEILKQN